MKRETKDNVKKDITKKKNMQKKIKDSLRKDTTKNVNRERPDCSKKEYSEADAKDVVSNPKSPPAKGPYARLCTGAVVMQGGSIYSQPVQQRYAAAAPVYLGTSAGYQGYQKKGSNQYQQHTQHQQ